MADRASDSSILSKVSSILCFERWAKGCFSAPSITRAIALTVSMGYLPTAVSALSITASVPSNTALATSNTSARVGVGAVIIDSIICVAVITTLLALLAASISCFCTATKLASPISTPRSPRATIMPSEASIIPGRNSSVMASARSILAIIWAVLPDCFRSSLVSSTSSFDCTNEMAR